MARFQGVWRERKDDTRAVAFSGFPRAFVTFDVCSRQKIEICSTSDSEFPFSVYFIHITKLVVELLLIECFNVTRLVMGI